MKLITLLLGVLLLAGYPLSAAATFYRYYDESGGVNVTNDKNSIPEKYRGQMTVISEKELADKGKAREREGRSPAPRQQQLQPQKSVPVAIEPAPVVTPAPVPDKREAAAPAGSAKSGWLDRQLPMLKVIALVALLVAAAVYAGKIVSSLAPRPLAIVIKVAMFVALAVYLVKGMAGKVSDAFDTIKDEASVAQKAVDKRSERIEKQAE
jgi:hypothetical protein